MAKLKPGRYVVLRANAKFLRWPVFTNMDAAIKWASLTSVVLTGQEYFVCRVEALVGPSEEIKK